MNSESANRLYDVPPAHVVKWLVAEGTRVKEDQQIAEIYGPAQYSQSLLVRQILKAPVNGTLIHLSPVQPPPPPSSQQQQQQQHSLQSQKIEQSSSNSLSLTRPSAQILYCTHSVVYSGLCTLCAVNVLALPPRSRQLWEMCHTESSSSSNADAKDAADAGPFGKGHKRRREDVFGVESGAASTGGGVSIPRGMTQIKVQHGFELSVSSALATNADSEILSRLRSRRKLCLVLDIDHTLIHCVSDEKAAAFVASITTGTTSIGSTIESENGVSSTSSPLSSALVRSTDVFSWNDGTVIYAIKKRPYLSEFLESASDFFELQVDTAGTRSYAEMVLSHIDPDKRLFGDRIVSRCDSRLRHKQVAWLHRAVKDDSMVVIVDDTTEVWRGAKNLLTIEPYMFWKSGVSKVELNNVSGRSMVDTSYGASSISWEDTDGAGTEKAAADVRLGSAATPPPIFEEEGHAFLRDILRFLKDIHREYYEEYDLYQSLVRSSNNTNTSSSLKTLTASTTTTTSTSSSSSSSSISIKSSRTVGSILEEGASRETEGISQAMITLPRVPSVPTIIHNQLRSILSNVCIVFSGVFSLSSYPEDTNLWGRALMFGASIAESPDSTRSMTKVHSQEELDNAVAIKGSEEPNAHDASAAYTALQNFNKKIVTHLVYRTAGTAKFESANKDPAIRVVPLAWLEQCILQYRRLPEEDFALAAFSHTGKPSLFDENQAALRVNDLI